MSAGSSAVRGLRGAAVGGAGLLVAHLVLGIEFDRQVVSIGVFTGLVYAVLAAGLVLVYRAARVINFAHADIGALCSVVLAELVLDHGWSYLAALAVAVPLGALIGFLIEIVIVRRLSRRPRLVLMVATVGVSQLLFYIIFISTSIDNATTFPSPIDRQLDLAGIVVGPEALFALAVMPAIVIGLGVLLNATPYGVAIRASAENSDAARLAAISTKRVSTLVWTLSGAIAAISVIAAAPLRGDIPGLAQLTGSPSILLRALAAALIGRFTSLPRTLAGGIVVGVVEAVVRVRWGVAEGNLVLAGLVAVLILVVVRRDAADTGGSFALTPKPLAAPARLSSLTWVRRLPTAGMAAMAVVGVVLPLVVTAPSQQQTFALMLVYALAGLSLTVLMGWAGQLSLGQFAFVGCGAATMVALTERGVPFAAAVGYAVVATVVVAVIVGLPALRVRGLFLAVTTISFAVATDSFIVPTLLGGEGSIATVPRPQLGPIDFADQRSFYYLCLVVLAAAAAAVAALRRSGIGRTLIAVRDNEQAAAAFTVSPVRAKLTAFAVSGALAALAGALFAALFVQPSPTAFGPEESLALVAMVIIGGLGSVPGTILGAVYVVGVPALFGSGAEIQALTTGPALLFLLLYLPGGLIQVVDRVRLALLRLAERRMVGPEPPPAAVPARAVDVSNGGHAALAPVTRRHASETPDTAVLRTVGVAVRFGGLTAVDGVDLQVGPGEIVGLIGSNGAGKSTFMNAVSGLVPATGQIWVLDQRVDHLSPAARAAAGLGRSFQDAQLFSDLTVHESVMVALEAREASELIPSMLTLPPSRRAERRKAAVADDLIALLGLGRYARRYISDLSTGTRRIADLACLLALEPRMLLLDEPTAGVAQREAEAFGPLLRRIQRDLGASVLLVEHDIPMVMSLSDRVYCMGVGRVIAEGPPEHVRNDPAVIASYLGTDERAIARSDIAGAGAGKGGPS